MLLDLIKNILEGSKESMDDLEAVSQKILEDVKSLAKKLFFEGKVQDLKDFIFDIPNERNGQIREEFVSSLNTIVHDGEAFMDQLKLNIQKKVEEFKMEKNLDSLLDILDYGHLKGFLKMFRS